MKNHMHERKLHNHLGPGGRKCPCCGPNPAYRKQHDRMIKRRIRQAVQRDVVLETRQADDLRAALPFSFFLELSMPSFFRHILDFRLFISNTIGASPCREPSAARTAT